MSDLISQLEEWYFSQCDGDWEHDEGITIGTLDNPGWYVRVSLAGTSVSGLPFTEVTDLASDSH
jgi:hypothetical protein